MPYWPTMSNWCKLCKNYHARLKCDSCEKATNKEIPGLLYPLVTGVIPSSAMELQLGVFGSQDSGFCWLHMKTKHKQNAYMIFVCCATFHTCLSSRSDCSTYSITRWITVTLITEKTRIPQLGIKMVQVLGSLVYICGKSSFFWNFLLLLTSKILR